MKVREPHFPGQFQLRYYVKLRQQSHLLATFETIGFRKAGKPKAVVLEGWKLREFAEPLVAVGVIRILQATGSFRVQWQQPVFRHFNKDCLPNAIVERSVRFNHSPGFHQLRTTCLGLKSFATP